MPASNAAGNANSPVGKAPALTGMLNAYGAPVAGQLAAPTGSAGMSVPHSVMNPFLVVNFVIALQGTYPSRQ